jgi:nicotinamide-nucleotide amidase
MTLPEILLVRATVKGLLIATAESCTGGLLAGAITDIAGSSAIFDRGFVTYSNAAKIAMLGVLPATLALHGAVSEPVAAAMAQGALQRSDAQIAVSVTGIAGPGGSEHKPEGRVCFGLASLGRVQTETVDFGAIGRAQVRRQSVDHALGLLLKAVEEHRATA